MRKKINELFDDLIEHMENNKEYCKFFKHTTFEKYVEELISELQELKHYKNKENLKEELGDVLYGVLNIIWKADQEGIKKEDVVEALLKKLKSRKPHTFEKKHEPWDKIIDYFFDSKKKEIEEKTKSLAKKELSRLKSETSRWKLKLKSKNITPLDKEGERILKNIKAYIKDTEYFESVHKYVEAFEAIVWAWAWMEIGEELGKLKVSDSYDKK